MLKDSLILTFSKGIRGVLMLIFNMIIARLFTESLYGTYKQINLIINLVTSICIVGIPTTISYFYISSSKKDKEKLIGNTIIILSIISLVTSILIIVFKENISLLLNNNNIVNYIHLISIQVFIMILSSFLENLYISSKNTVILGKIYLGYTIINFIVLGYITIFTKDLYLLVLFMVIIEFLRSIIMYFIIYRKEELKLRFEYDLLYKQIKFALPLGIVGLVQNLNMYIDNLFISNRFSTEKYAAYANAATDIPLVGIITISIASVALPLMSKNYAENNDKKSILSIWGESCEKTAIIMFPIFWIVLLFAKEYIEFIFSSKYIYTSTPIFIIYLMKFPLYFTVFGNILIVMKQQKYIMINSVVGIILNIILNIIFLNIFGIIGPAISTVVTQYLVVYLQLNRVKKQMNIKFSEILPYKKLFKIFLSPIIVVIPMYILSEIFVIPSSFRIIIFGGAMYIGIMLLFIKIKIINLNNLNLKWRIRSK